MAFSRYMKWLELLCFSCKSSPKIYYFLTPPARLSNIGDHAQVIAIKHWLNTYFNDCAFIELDKDQTAFFIKKQRHHLKKHDLILLHSGGNMGDRGIWSEGLRRQIIEHFPENKIVSLPQTIFFSDSETGQKEKTTSSQIYNKHPHLMVYARDKVSHDIAKTIFQNITVKIAPDFVLSMKVDHTSVKPTSSNKNVLLCIRGDKESVLSADDKKTLEKSLDATCRFFDTTFPHLIMHSMRNIWFNHTLQLFRQCDVIITDRLHGLIFSIITKRPVIVLCTSDHKMTASLRWFEHLDFVTYADNIESVPNYLNAIDTTMTFDTPDWNEDYFKPLAQDVRQFFMLDH